MTLSLPSALSALTAEPRWVGWRWVRRPNGKMDKPPCCAYAPSKLASTADAMTWAPFPRACEALSQKLVDGIGYVVRQDGERIFLDLDNCRDPATGDLSPWAQEIVEEANSYTEVTPSGTGLRIIGSNDFINNEIHRQLKMPDDGVIEIYLRAGRFVTVTGDRLPGTPDVLSPIADIAIHLLERGGSDVPDSDGNMPPPHQPNEQAAAPLPDIASALQQIRNDDLTWDGWSRIGMAAWRASGGDQAALDAWKDWSAKSPKHDDATCDERWRHWFNSPPTRLGFGTLYHTAHNANPLWVPPSRRGEIILSADASGQPSPPDRTAPDVYPTLGIEDVLALPPVEWLVEGWLTTDGFSIAYGAPGSFKSFIGVDIALSVAYGMPWQGCKTRQGGVLYVAGEGIRGLKRRIIAWQRKKGVEGVDAPFRLLPVGVNLTDPEQAEKVVRTVLAAAEAEASPIRLVVVDTVARAMAGADENSSQDMGRLVAAADAIRANCAAAALGIHHTGKDKDRGARGSSALKGAVDTMIAVDRTDDTLSVTIKTEKQKDEEPAEPIRLEGEKDPLTPLGTETSLVFARDASAMFPATHDAKTAEMLLQAARIIKPDGRMVLRNLCQALGMPYGGSAYQRIAAVIPYSPNACDVVADGVPVRLWMERSSAAAKAPVEVVCHAL